MPTRTASFSLSLAQATVGLSHMCPSLTLRRTKERLACRLRYVCAFRLDPRCGSLYFHARVIRELMDLKHAPWTRCPHEVSRARLRVQVLRCLGLATDGSSGHHVMVRYKLLKRGTFARVQPVKRRFRTEVADVKLFLEHELHLRTTLSEGDELEVGTGAERHVLRILELKPESAVSLIDTDLEVEVNASVEEEEEVAAAEAERRRAEAAAAAFAAEQEAKRAAAAAAAAAAEREAEEREKAAAAAAREEREGRRREAAAVLQSGSLASASGGSGGGEVKVVVRCPDGSRCSGTFARTAPLALLFALVEAEWVEALGAPLLPQEFRLAASYPRRAFDRAQAQAATLESAGLGSAQEALFVEIPGVQA
uniref:UBX domain-containing protein n=1 Tax=Chrysotila carterae TaxID=13221 RepID=A0A7S4BTC4_CHRCT